MYFPYLMTAERTGVDRYTPIVNSETAFREKEYFFYAGTFLLLFKYVCLC